MERLIKEEEGIIVAMDESNVKRFEELVKLLCEAPEVVGWKLSGRNVLLKGLEEYVRIIREYSKKPIILDYQKGGSDIPYIEEKFIKEIGGWVDGYIIFPFSGVVTLEVCVECCREVGVVPIVGGYMTHEGYARDSWIREEGIWRIFEKSREIGVNHYVVPGNRPYVAKKIKGIVESVQPAFFTPGIGAQGGEYRRIKEVLRPYKVYPIVGRSIISSEEPLRVVKGILREGGA